MGKSEIIIYFARIIDVKFLLIRGAKQYHLELTFRNKSPLKSIALHSLYARSLRATNEF
jgi:hypothetical protein